MNVIVFKPLLSWLIEAFQTHLNRRAEQQRAYTKRNPEKARASEKKWRLNNPEKTAADTKAWRAANPEKVKQMARRNFQNHRQARLDKMKEWRTTSPERAKESHERTMERLKANPEKYAVYCQRRKDYALANRVRINARTKDWHRERRNKDAAFRLLGNLRHRVWCALQGHTKSVQTVELIGCSVEALQAHLERHFKPGMTWQNYGPNWHIDHIRPCASFDLTQPEQQRQCFHWSNLQPLWAADNIRKSDSWQ